MSTGSKAGAMVREVNTNAEIAGKRDAVERADIAFSASMLNASAVGRGTIERAVAAARPVLIGVGILAVGGVTLVLLRRSPTTRLILISRRGPSLTAWSLARAAAVTFAAAAGRRLVERWLRRANGAGRNAAGVQPQAQQAHLLREGRPQSG